jgi:hypothetical protein
MTVSGLNESQEGLAVKMLEAGIIYGSPPQVDLVQKNSGTEKVHEILPQLARELYSQARRSRVNYDMIVTFSGQGYLLANALHNFIVREDHYRVPHVTYEELVESREPIRVDNLLVVDATSYWEESAQMKIQKLKKLSPRLSVQCLVLIDDQERHSERVVGLFTPHILQTLCVS